MVSRRALIESVSRLEPMRCRISVGKVVSRSGPLYGVCDFVPTVETGAVEFSHMELIEDTENLGMSLMAVWILGLFG